MVSATKEKEYFIENLVMLTGSGMDIVSALETIRADIKTPSLKKTLSALEDTIARGEPIFRSLEETQLFKPHVISLVRLGEQSGKLFENLGVISLQQKKERVFKSKMHSALMYPAFILSIAAIVGLGVAWYILPNLASVFSQLKLSLPLITKVLIAIGLFLKSFGVFVIPLFIGVCILCAYVIFGHPKTKWVGQALLLTLPGIGPLVRTIELARMGYIVGTLLRAGVPIVDTLRSLSDTAPLARYHQLYTYLVTSVERGTSIKQCFQGYPRINRLIPTPIQQMIIAGEQSGRLSETFLRVGELFEEKTEDTTKNLSVILEPILLLIVWISVVGIALAVIMPIYSLIGGLNR